MHISPAALVPSVDTLQCPVVADPVLGTCKYDQRQRQTGSPGLCTFVQVPRLAKPVLCVSKLDKVALVTVEMCLSVQVPQPMPVLLEAG